MKFRIIRFGKEFLIKRKFLWWYKATELPTYDSVADCKSAIFRAYGIIPTDENIEVQEEKTFMSINSDFGELIYIRKNGEEVSISGINFGKGNRCDAIITVGRNPVLREIALQQTNIIIKFEDIVKTLRCLK